MTVPILTEEKLWAAHAKYKADNKALAQKVAETMRPFATALTDSRARRFFESALSGMANWSGHVGQFGYTGVRCRRATFCVDMDFVESPEPAKETP